MRYVVKIYASASDGWYSHHATDDYDDAYMSYRLAVKASGYDNVVICDEENGVTYFQGEWYED